jgi:hypothetical protein
MLQQQPTSEPQQAIHSQTPGSQNNHDSRIRHRSSWQWQAKGWHWKKMMVGAILCVGLVLQCIGAWQDSQTTDEAVHLSAGYSYWVTNDHRLNPEHPPLVKMMAAAPLLFVPNIAFSTTMQGWVKNEQWNVGANLVHNSGASGLNAQQIMFLGRLPMIFLWLCLGLLLGWVARRVWGEAAQFVTTTLFVFEPSFLGHGHLVTTDIGMSLGFLGTMILLERFLQHPGWKTALAVAFVLGLAEVAKFSAIILWLLVPMITLIRMIPKSSPVRWRHVGMLALSVITVPLLITFCVYGFDRSRLAETPLISHALSERARFEQDPKELSWQPPFIKALFRVTDPDTRTGQAITSILNANIPAMSYLHGLLETANHDFWGHASFLLGHTGNRGWWYYFPVAVAVKLPTLTFVLLLITMAWFIVRWIRTYQWRIPSLFWTLGFPPLAFLAWSMTGHINIGVRHVFPFMIFIPLWIGALTTTSIWKRFHQPLMLGTLAISATITLLAFPHTLNYFAGWTGGTGTGWKILQDSNFDWGQDLWRLDTYLETHDIVEPHIASVGSAPLDKYLPKDSIGIMTDDQYNAGERPSGTTIVGAGILFDPNQPVEWLRKRTPAYIIGSTYYVFPTP